MSSKESTLIAKTFDLALGKPDPYPNLTRQTLIESLADDYRFFGISSGRKHAQQLLRRLEKAVVDQTKEHLGKARD